MLTEIRAPTRQSAKRCVSVRSSFGGIFSVVIVVVIDVAGVVAIIIVDEGVAGVLVVVVVDASRFFFTGISAILASPS